MPDYQVHPPRQKLKNIELVAYDFDGVMTNNTVILREDGQESVIVNRSDGLAIGILKSWGIRQLILSTERNRIVSARAKKLKIPCLQGVNNKKQALIRYCRKEGLRLENTVYVGNDINDVEVLRIVGHPVCPADAYAEVKEIAAIILSVTGGAGVARDLIRYIAHRRNK